MDQHKLASLILYDVISETACYRGLWNLQYKLKACVYNCASIFTVCIGK